VQKKSFIFVLMFIAYLYSQSSEMSLNSEYMATIRVTIGGNVGNSGTYIASRNEKLDQFITRIFNTAKVPPVSNNYNQHSSADEIDAGQQKLEEVKLLRGIKLIRKGETSPINIDLYKFRLTGKQELNPYLEDDDVIIFPTINHETNVVELTGAVNQPGKYLCLEGDKLNELIEFAGGVDKSFDNNPIAEISRLSANGQKEQIYSLKTDSDFLLKSGDRINVNAGENSKKFYKVKVVGEIHNPGEIFITKNSTTIFDVIKKSGGFNINADLSKAELIRSFNNRDSIKTIQNSRLIDRNMMARMSAISDEDSVIFSIDNLIRLEKGNGSIDFNKLNDSASVESQFVVQDGDLINIPVKQELVYVFGQITNPGYTQYKKDADVGYYIAACGGVGSMAKDEIYLIKGKSRAWILLDEKNKVQIEQGDFIWIAKKPIRNFDFYLRRVGSIASIVGGITTTIILLISL